MGIYEKLSENAESGIYPMHMPGHKRNGEFLKMANPYTIDITEVDGFDDLHSPEGIILEAMEKGRKLYKSLKCYLLVNGSSCGILSAVSACARKGGKIIAARNCHKSVYNAISLNRCDSVYLFPETDKRCGICKGITPEAVEKALAENHGASAVVITSPTYEGVVSDIKGISEVTRKYAVPLIVDEAHGAHLGFSEDFPQSAVTLGADFVIQSVHKTLPAFTQTALLHVCSSFAEKYDITRFLSLFQSSSPSYILMAGIDRCFDILEENAAALFENYSRLLDKFYNETASLKKVKVIPPSFPEGFKRDKGKILIDLSSADLTGAELADILLKKYKIQLEMSSAHYAIAMTSICDTPEGFERLSAALKEIDENAESTEKKFFTPLPENAEKVMTVSEAQSRKTVFAAAAAAENKISGEFIYAYPPGIPISAPGERLTAEVISLIENLTESGVAVKSSSGALPLSIRVIDIDT